METFLIEYNVFLRQALHDHPELKAEIETAAASVLDRAVEGAFKNQKVYDLLQTAPELVITAAAASRDAAADLAAKARQAAAALIASQVQRSKDFFAGDVSIAGTGSHFKRGDVRQLISGRIHFADLDSLLRFSPIGTLYTRDYPSTYYNPQTKKTEPAGWSEIRATYPGGRIVQLYYWTSHRIGEGDRIPVVLAPDGYRISEGLPLPYPEFVTAEAREENSRIINRLIDEARRRGV